LLRQQWGGRVAPAARGVDAFHAHQRLATRVLVDEALAVPVDRLASADAHVDEALERGGIEALRRGD